MEEQRPIYTVEATYPSSQFVLGERLLPDGEEPFVGGKWYIGEQSHYYIPEEQVVANPHIFKKHS